MRDPRYCVHSLKVKDHCSRARGECLCGLQRTEKAIELGRVADTVRARGRPATPSNIGAHLQANAQSQPVLLKTCRKCGESKPNTFTFFGKKLHGSMTTFATVDVCKACSNAALRDAINRSWRHRG